MSAKPPLPTPGNSSPQLNITQLSEVMTAICIDGVSYAVMLSSPFDLEDFARGFALSEALIHTPSELRDIRISENDEGFTLDLILSARAQHAAKQRRRLMQGNSGCGLCGADAIAYAQANKPPRVPFACIPSAAQIHAAREQLPALQIRNRAIGGGMHAAVLFSIGNSSQSTVTALVAREDIGRHNALDKLIGAFDQTFVQTTNQTIDLENIEARTIAHRNIFSMLTSRCSYELVLKCARAKIGALVTFATPTTLAVQCAQQCNITLACYQGPHLNYYHIATDDFSNR